eukprot:GHVU01203374.1.p1 GENE.GHVU01203374.1~~GHVU01203374.1.p1  ORF type:complete len:135 (-),score=14.39 GHVU01203374.1:1022-1426(-)
MHVPITLNGKHQRPPARTFALARTHVRTPALWRNLDHIINNSVRQVESDGAVKADPPLLTTHVNIILFVSRVMDNEGGSACPSVRREKRDTHRGKKSIELSPPKTPRRSPPLFLHIIIIIIIIVIIIITIAANI